MQPLNLSPSLRKSLAGVAVFFLALVLIATVPLQINPGLDFSQFYADLFGILRGDAIYNHLAHAQHYAEHTHGKPLPLNPPVYPPWYYAIFLPLGVFSISTGAQLWGWINLAFFFCALGLLTDRLPLRTRAAIMATCLLFAPVTGHLVVGQQTMILLTGVALVIRGIEHGSSPLTAGGLLLLTFKPHLGLPIAAAVLFWLLLRHSPLAVSTITRSFAGFLLLIILSLVLDQHSLADYPESLRQLSALSLNQVCDTCSSLALTIQRSLDSTPDRLWLERFLISALLGTFLIIPALVARLSDRAFISASVCVVLLAAPYIRNYDYVLLLAPVVALMEEGLIKPRSRRVKSLARKILCIFGFFIAGILPLFTSRESHSSFMWISAALVYLACFTGRKS